MLFNAAPLLLHILSLVRYRVKMEIKQQHMLPLSLVMDVMASELTSTRQVLMLNESGPSAFISEVAL